MSPAQEGGKGECFLLERSRCEGSGFRTLTPIVSLERKGSVVQRKVKVTLYFFSFWAQCGAGCKAWTCEEICTFGIECVFGQHLWCVVAFIVVSGATG